MINPESDTAFRYRRRARGFGVDEPASPWGLFSQVGGRLAAMRGFADRYFVQARTDGLIMLSSQTVMLNQTTAWTTPRLGALLGVDAGARLSDDVSAARL